MRKKPNYTLIAGITLALIILLPALASAVCTPYPPEAQNAAEKLAAPSPAHIMGTDNLGRDIFSRVMSGAGTTLFIAGATVAIGAVFGSLIGAVTGYRGGAVDAALMRFNDTVTAFPAILLALVIISLLGPGKYNIILALGLLFIPSYARLVRGAVASVKELDYVKSAKLTGASAPRIVVLHILPNIKTTLLSSLAVGFNNAVLAEAGMSYLGIGVQPPEPSLGRMLSESQSFLFSAPWYAVFTGSVVALMILAFSLIGDGARR